MVQQNVQDLTDKLHVGKLLESAWLGGAAEEMDVKFASLFENMFKTEHTRVLIICVIHMLLLR